VCRCSSLRSRHQRRQSPQRSAPAVAVKAG
jgi:hypothetical protein